MRRWLEEFAYRTSLEPGLFAGAFLLVFVVAVATAVSQALKAVHNNPTASLRHE